MWYRRGIIFPKDDICKCPGVSLLGTAFHTQAVMWRLTCLKWESTVSGGVVGGNKKKPLLLFPALIKNALNFCGFSEETFMRTFFPGPALPAKTDVPFLRPLPGTCHPTPPNPRSGPAAPPHAGRGWPCRAGGGRHATGTPRHARLPSTPGPSRGSSTQNFTVTRGLETKRAPGLSRPTFLSIAASNVTPLPVRGDRPSGRARRRCRLPPRLPSPPAGTGRGTRATARRGWRPFTPGGRGAGGGVGVTGGEAPAAAAAAPSPPGRGLSGGNCQGRGVDGRRQAGDTATNGPGGAGQGRSGPPYSEGRGKAPPPAPVMAGPPSGYLEERCGRVSLAAGAGQQPRNAMKGSGIENPVFEPPSPDLGRQRQTRPAGAGAGVPAAAAEEGPCGWGRCAPKALQLCNNPEGYLAAYSLLAIFQGNPSPAALSRAAGTQPFFCHLPPRSGTWSPPAFCCPGHLLELQGKPGGSLGWGSRGGSWWRFGWWVRGSRVPPTAQVWCQC